MENHSLLCDEKLIDTPPPSLTSTTTTTFSLSTSTGVLSPGRDDAIKSLLQSKNSACLISGDYVSNLLNLPQLISLRSTGIRWIIMACERLDLSYETVFCAVNYLDRFVSNFVDKKWENWMMELTSIACFSIASKFVEVTVPSLYALPMDDLENLYDPATIQKMELLVLDALQWRLHCVTPHSYLHLLLQQSTSSSTLSSIIVDNLLLSSLLDVRLLNYNPFNVAVSAVRLAALDLIGTADLLDIPMGMGDDAELKRCYELLKERVKNNATVYGSFSMVKFSFYSPLSPVTVLRPPSRVPVAHRCVGLDAFFLNKEKKVGGSDDYVLNRKRIRKG